MSDNLGFFHWFSRLVANCHDDAAKLVRLLSKPGCPYLVAEDLIPLIQDVVDTHPGLTFLQDAPEFHSRYVHTVSCSVSETTSYIETTLAPSHKKWKRCKGKRT